MGLYFEQWRKTLMTLFGPIPVSRFEVGVARRDYQHLSRFGISQQLL